MRRKRTAIYLSALLATALYAVPAFAADAAGKWYGKLDSEPTISINKAGPEFSASLDYIDSMGQTVQGSRVLQASSHKHIASFRVAGGNVRFSIGTMTVVHGDTNYQRDDYNLDLSGDGRQMTGIVTHIIEEESTDPLRITRAPITLFLRDQSAGGTQP